MVSHELPQCSSSNQVSDPGYPSKDISTTILGGWALWKEDKKDRGTVGLLQQVCTPRKAETGISPTRKPLSPCTHPAFMFKPVLSNMLKCMHHQRPYYRWSLLMSVCSTLLKVARAQFFHFKAVLGQYKLIVIQKNAHMMHFVCGLSSW